MSRKNAQNKQRISGIVNKRLFAIMTIGFIVIVTTLWGLQNSLAKSQAEETLVLNVNDVKADIQNASDANMLRLAEEVKEALLSYDEINESVLYKLWFEYEVDEIHVVDKNGYIVETTIPAFRGYDMSSGAQSEEFLVLLDGTTTSVVQEYGPISYDPSMEKKYAGVALPEGFMQIGYEASLFQKDMMESVKSVTGNRHVGKSGFVMIVDERGRIVSSRKGDIGDLVSKTGLDLGELNGSIDKVFRDKVYGEKSVVLCTKTEGYYLVAIMPEEEIVLSRNASVLMLSILEALAFLILFYEIFLMLKKLVIKNITSVNESLRMITSGDLEVKVDVRDNLEFDQLSTDINTTVDTIKSYIEEAKQRMEAELSLAREIQTSTIPSVFPPYPNRKEFDIFGSMVTAKEVGGDFFDFCLVG
ncbi:MAG: hypothetical protein KBS81_11960, partial [Spirochaetales bacterium]|nr:hypothetical protein [Candidatus Physcosoma equi]